MQFSNQNSEVKEAERVSKEIVEILPQHQNLLFPLFSHLQVFENMMDISIQNSIPALIKPSLQIMPSLSSSSKLMSIICFRQNLLQEK